MYRDNNGHIGKCQWWQARLVEPSADQMTSQPGEHYLKGDIGNVNIRWEIECRWAKK